MLQYLGRVSYYQGEQKRGLQYAEEALEILEKAESGMSFRGPAALGVLAMTTRDEKRRQAVMQQAEDLLDAGSISHNYLNFYEDAMEISLTTRNWDAVDRYAAKLEEYTQEEPMPSCDFHIARGRALAAHGRGERSQSVANELQRLHDEAQNIGLKLALPALEDALENLQNENIR